MDSVESTNYLTKESQVSDTSTISVVSVRCRICYDNEKPEELMAPCQCKGTMAFVHRSCLETWLGESGLTYCELCSQSFTTERTPKYTSTKSIWTWFKCGSRHPARSLRGDVIACGIVNPLTIIVTYICLYSSEYYDHQRFSSPSKWTAVCLLLVIGILFFGYYLWASSVLRTYSLMWYSWWQRSCIVRYIAPSTISLNSRTEDQVHVPNNSPCYSRNISWTEDLYRRESDLLTAVVIHSEALLDDEDLNKNYIPNYQNSRTEVKGEENSPATATIHKALLDKNLVDSGSSEYLTSIRTEALTQSENDLMETNFDAVSEGKGLIKKQENNMVIEKTVQPLNNIYPLPQYSILTDVIGHGESSSAKPGNLEISSESTIKSENKTVIDIEVDQSCNSSGELDLE
ncbi:unnamed protein product [Ceutorhynchus assimilis]|uniref:RING-CH-type domain-containing protein n=1 Tax=Ceutorhynchus assimilis TaxID=467358 RepID=A0A9N9QL58_9CUCU|nr:unnamed protein product [Ceutorhynchus assimilis]